jgi:hypothetical protein
MLYRIVEVIEFSSTDCEDTHEMVSTIIKALARAGVVKDGDKFHYTDNHETVKVCIYRPQPNGSGGDGN